LVPEFIGREFQLFLLRGGTDHLSVRSPGWYTPQDLSITHGPWAITSAPGLSSCARSCDLEDPRNPPGILPRTLKHPLLPPLDARHSAAGYLVSSDSFLDPRTIA
jgi:hypothetical protein